MKALRQLDLLAIHDDLGNEYEREVAPAFQQMIAQSYEERIGVHPQYRQEFREALARIADGSGGRVQLVIDSFRRRFQLNGLSSR